MKRYVAAALIAIGVSFPHPQSLAAQGGAQATPATPLARSRVVPAKNILRGLVGTWRFEMRFAGNLDGPPDASGTRVVTVLFDDLRLEWTETLDDSPMQGRGVIGFDARSERFFSTSVYSAGSGPEFLTGILDDGEPLITFSPVPIAPGATPDQTRMRSSTLSILDGDHFTWAALDRGWRAVFTRQP